MYIFQNALKNLKRNKGRNILVGIILFSIITTMGISFIINTTAEGIIDDYKNRFGSEALIMPDFEKISQGSGVYNLENITVSKYKEIAKSQALKEYELSTELSTVGHGVKAKDEDKNSGQSMSMTTNIDGGEVIETKMPTLKLLATTNSSLSSEFEDDTRKIVEGEIYKEKDECIISEDLAKINKIKVGDEIELENTATPKGKKIKLKVAGIYRDLTKEYSFDFKQAYMNRRNEILTSFETSEQYLGDTGYVIAKFILKSPHMLESFTEDVRKAGIGEDYKVTTDEEGYNKIVAPVEGLTKVTNMFMMVVFVLGGGILVLLSVMAIRERKYEVGVLRAMGMKKWKVTLQFLSENIIITLICLLMGIGASTIGAQPVADNLLENQIKIVEQQQNNMSGGFIQSVDSTRGGEISEIEKLNVSLNSEVILKIIMVSMVLAILSSGVSIGYIMKYEPIKILSERN